MLQVVNESSRFFYAKGLPFPAGTPQNLPDSLRPVIKQLIANGLPIKILEPTKKKRKPAAKKPAAKKAAPKKVAPEAEAPPEAEVAPPEAEAVSEEPAEEPAEEPSKKSPRARRSRKRLRTVSDG